MRPTLTDTYLRNLRPKDRLYRESDGKGLYIEVTPAGAKLWRFRYRLDGKTNMVSLGRYPSVSLAQARRLRDEYRAKLDQGIDPAQAKKKEKLQRQILNATTFEAIASEWIERHLSSKAPGHREKVVRRLERDVFPYLGSRPIADITAPEILQVVRRIEKRGVLETAHRALQNIGQVIRYAIATGRATFDPTPSLRGALPPVKSRHMAAPTDSPSKVGEFLRMMEAFKGGPVVAAALRLLPYLFVRPGELRTMRWEDVDLQAAEWRFITSKTKTEHIVPLSRQALAILRDLYPLTGHLPGGWVFPGGRSPLKPLSEAAINAAYRRLGIDTQNELTGHGWRATARTFLHERLNYPAEIIEHQLAHAVPDSLGRAYNRTRFLADRKKMMQAWGDYLDDLRNQTIVVPFATKTA
ncbi:MAG: integrase arm-type DNA-binding domain-containing protein [Pseudomonadota bacterium]